jgi:hypothetical protein
MRFTKLIAHETMLARTAQEWAWSRDSFALLIPLFPGMGVSSASCRDLTGQDRVENPGGRAPFQ